MRRATAVALLLLVTACGAGAEQPKVEGVVIEVDGGLVDVRSFTVRTSGGTDLTFRAVDGLRFHGEGPLGHLRAHLTSGEPVVVSYETLSDGSLEAVDVADGDR